MGEQDHREVCRDPGADGDLDAALREEAGEPRPPPGVELLVNHGASLPVPVPVAHPWNHWAFPLT